MMSYKLMQPTVNVSIHIDTADLIQHLWDKVKSLSPLYLVNVVKSERNYAWLLLLAGHCVRLASQRLTIGEDGTSCIHVTVVIPGIRCMYKCNSSNTQYMVCWETIGIYNHWWQGKASSWYCSQHSDVPAAWEYTFLVFLRVTTFSLAGESFITVTNLARCIPKASTSQYLLEELKILSHYRVQAFHSAMIKFVTSMQSKSRMSLTKITPPVLAWPCFRIESISCAWAFWYGPCKCHGHGLCQWKSLLSHVHEVRHECSVFLHSQHSIRSRFSPMFYSSLYAIIQCLTGHTRSTKKFLGILIAPWQIPTA